jgi:peptidoglycan/LPS O-acetylase OafA/YrhL
MSLQQWGAGRLLVNTPWGHFAHASVFDGSLWSLKYELLCYVIAAVVAVVAVRIRTRWLAVTALAVSYAYLIGDAVSTHLAPGQPFPHRAFLLPGLGYVDTHYLFYLGFVFLLGANAQLFADRIPVSNRLAIASAVALLASMVWGGFFLFGLPSYAYLLLWASVRLPTRLSGVGRRRDLSYGIYLYGFPTQQVLLSLGAHRPGPVGYAVWVVAVVVITTALAWLSWTLIERPALRMKHWQPGWARALGRAAVSDQASA